jgi:transposase InsO family protein
MANKTEKDRIIRQVYYDADTGFSSTAETYRDSKKILNSITYNDVKEFLSRQKSLQFKPYRGYNSYVADAPLEELQIDISDFTKSSAVNHGYRYALVGIDIFSKMAHVVPIKNKMVNESIRAMKEIFEKIGIPKQIYHDNESAWSMPEFLRLLNQNKVKQIITSAPPPFAERFIASLKDAINKRLEGLEIEKQKWMEQLPKFLNKYNNHSIHSSTKMTPREATDPNHRLEVWLNIKSRATYARKYAPLKVGDSVRTFVKKTSFNKKTDKRWSEQVYKILAIDDGSYLINDPTRRRVFQRHDLLKIDAVEGKAGVIDS